MIDLAIIPARAGSKGIPGKNIALLHGKPLLHWTINAAIQSGCFKRIVLSTDSEEIALVAQESGAEVPFLRPDFLSNSTANTSLVINHTISTLSLDGSFALLQPTSPFRTSEHIIGACSLFESNLSLYNVVAFTETKPLSWHFTKSVSVDVPTVKPIHISPSSRRQDEDPLLIPNGSIYISSTALFTPSNSFFDPYPLPYLMTSIPSLDIDYPEDLALASAIADLGYLQKSL